MVNESAFLEHEASSVDRAFCEIECAIDILHDARKRVDLPQRFFGPITFTQDEIEVLGKLLCDVSGSLMYLDGLILDAKKSGGDVA